jgi:hypothetical protein
MAKELTKEEVESRFVASLRKDQAREAWEDVVTMSNQSVGLAMALAEKRRCTYDEVIEWANENVSKWMPIVKPKPERVVKEWVVAPDGPGAFDYGFHCFVCDRHFERLSAEEARAIAGSHVHRPDAGCGFCRDGLTADQMLAEGRTLCRSCHDKVSELLAPAEGESDESDRRGVWRHLDAEEAAENLTW